MSAKKEYKLKNQDTKVVTTQYRYVFDDKELVELGREAGRQDEEWNNLELQLSSIKKDYSSKMESAENLKNRAFGKMKDGFEMRDTQALVKFFPKKKKKHIFHLDESKKSREGEFIREEDMTPSDFERDLFEEKAKDEKKDAPFNPALTEKDSKKIETDPEDLE